MIFNILNIKTEIKLTKKYIEPDDPLYNDLRNEIHPKKRQTIGENYYNETPYPQVFDSKHGFIANLSIIDLIFNMGYEASDYLKNE